MASDEQQPLMANEVASYLPPDVAERYWDQVAERRVVELERQAVRSDAATLRERLVDAFGAAFWDLAAGDCPGDAAYADVTMTVLAEHGLVETEQP